jgi:metallo-beta-lactamase family protein
LSAHGDQKTFVKLVVRFKEQAFKVFIVHGENQPADELRLKLLIVTVLIVVFPLLGQNLNCKPLFDFCS